MITFKATFKAYGLDKKAYVERIKEAIQIHLIKGALKFMTAALKKIPTFNPPTGGIASDWSTGFVAGAFGAIADAAGKYARKAKLPALEIEAPEGIVSLNNIVKRTITRAKARIKTVQAERLRQARDRLRQLRESTGEEAALKRLHDEFAGITRRQVEHQTGEEGKRIPKEESSTNPTLGGPLSRAGRRREARVYIRSAVRAAKAKYKATTHEFIKQQLEEIKNKRLQGERVPKIEELLILKRSIKHRGKTIRIKINPYYYPGKVLKLPRAARQPPFVPAQDEIFKQKGATFQFNFWINISYLTLQDIGGGYSKYAPWGAFEAGRIAMANYLQENNIKNILPSLGDFLQLKTIYTVSGIQINKEEKQFIRPTGQS